MQSGSWSQRIAYSSISSFELTVPGHKHLTLAGTGAPQKKYQNQIGLPYKTLIVEMLRNNLSVFYLVHAEFFHFRTSAFLHGHIHVQFECNGIVDNQWL